MEFSYRYYLFLLLEVCRVFILMLSIYILDYCMDGQLGSSGEDSSDENYIGGIYSLVPRLLNKFLELHPPDSSTFVSEAEGKGSIKV